MTILRIRGYLPTLSFTLEWPGGIMQYMFLQVFSWAYWIPQKVIFEFLPRKVWLPQCRELGRWGFGGSAFSMNITMPYLQLCWSTSRQKILYFALYRVKPLVFCHCARRFSSQSCFQVALTQSSPFQVPLLPHSSRAIQFFTS